MLTLIKLEERRLDLDLAFIRPFFQLDVIRKLQLYRHFSWLTKSCFPNPQHHHHHQPHLHRPSTTITSTAFSHQPPTISSLPDDLLLDCLSRVPPSTLPSLSLVCRRWSNLLDSPSFHHLRRLHGLLHQTLFAITVTDSNLLLTATHQIGPDSTWNENDAVSSNPGIIFHDPFSLSRVTAIGRKIYIISRTSTVLFDTWTGVVAEKSPMLFPRKKFAAAAVGEKIYVAGGAARTSAVEEYDPCNESWRVVSDAPRKRYGCVGASVDGVFYMIGGLRIGASTGEEFSRAAGAEASYYYASSMDLYDVEARGWLRSRVVPGGGCVVAACAVEEGYVYVLTSHVVELSFWRFDGRRKKGGSVIGEWCRMKSPPQPVQVRLDNTMRFNCVGIGKNKAVVIQVMGCVDDLLRSRGGRRRRGKEAVVMVYDGGSGEWSRGPDLPEVIRRAAFVCVEC